jgi:hypothetical protein
MLRRTGNSPAEIAEGLLGVQRDAREALLEAALDRHLRLLCVQNVRRALQMRPTIEPRSLAARAALQRVTRDSETVFFDAHICFAFRKVSSTSPECAKRRHFFQREHFRATHLLLAAFRPFVSSLRRYFTALALEEHPICAGSAWPSTVLPAVLITLERRLCGRRRVQYAQRKGCSRSRLVSDAAPATNVIAINAHDA